MNASQVTVRISQRTVRGPATIQLAENEHVIVCAPGQGCGMPGPGTVDVPADGFAVVGSIFRPPKDASHSSLADG